MNTPPVWILATRALGFASLVQNGHPLREVKRHSELDIEGSPRRAVAAMIEQKSN